MKNFIQLLIGVLVILLSGCASVPMSSLEKDATAKNFSAQPGKGSLFIYRNETMGAAVPITVSVNGKTLGQTAAMTYFHLNVAPGKYVISSHAEDVSSLGLDVTAGKNYFVWQEIKMGMWSARSKLQQTDEIKGRAGVTESKLIASSVSDDEFSVVVSGAAEQKTEAVSSTSQKLRDLQGLKNDGVITESDFENKKQQLLKSF